MQECRLLRLGWIEILYKDLTRTDLYLDTYKTTMSLVPQARRRFVGGAPAAQENCHEEFLDWSVLAHKIPER